MWRRDTVDIAYGWLSADADYEKTVEATVFDILYLYASHIRAPFSGGTDSDLDVLIYRTTEIVCFAIELSIIMRRCRNGTWSPFIPIRGVRVTGAIMPHEDRDASLPPDQDDVRTDSRVTLTVVPGLSKYEMQPTDDDPAQPGVAMTQIVKIVRMRAKCLIDLTQAETGKRLDGDIPVAPDL